MRAGTGAAVAAAVGAAVLLVTACSSSNDSNTTGENATTTTVDRSHDAAYAEPGPYPVGVRTFTLPDGQTKVDVWYPSTEEAVAGTPTATYRLSDWLPAALQSRVPAGVDDFATVAHRDVAPSTDGPFPVVLFSHGYASYRDQSSFLTTHLASYGMVVAAPDHLSRGLVAVIGGGQPDPGAAQRDMRATVMLLRNTVGATGGPLAGALDFDTTAIIGHSAGSGTAIQEAGDAQLGMPIDAYIAMSAGDFRGTTTQLPAVPAVFMAGSVDASVPAAETRMLYDRATGKKRFYEFAKSGHLVFTDICQIGKAQGGVLALAKTFGISVTPQLQKLATDGCQASATPTPEVWPAIDHFTVANLRALWGVDEQPVGLDATDRFGAVKITTASGG
jgi:fermentation-respiration switch protein FrsA (DUF1100 family)